METDASARPAAEPAAGQGLPQTPPAADGAGEVVVSPTAAAEPAQPPLPAAAAALGEPPVGPWRYWLRPLLLSVLVAILLALTWWDQRRIPDRPARPDVLTATPPAGATVTGSEPGLTDSLLRLRTALVRRDARALANLADPDGVIVATYTGGLPDGGLTMGDAYRLAQDTLAGAQISVLRWRTDGRGRVIVLADGWRRRRLRVPGAGALELTPLTAIGLAPRAGTWYWKWLLPDETGALAQQARTIVWQPWPA
jgi:hypothetical protein